MERATEASRKMRAQLPGREQSRGGSLRGKPPALRASACGSPTDCLWGRLPHFAAESPQESQDRARTEQTAVEYCAVRKTYKHTKTNEKSHYVNRSS